MASKDVLQIERQMDSADCTLGPGPAQLCVFYSTGALSEEPPASPSQSHCHSCRRRTLKIRITAQPVALQRVQVPHKRWEIVCVCVRVAVRARVCACVHVCEGS